MILQASALERFALALIVIAVLVVTLVVIVGEVQRAAESITAAVTLGLGGTP